MTDQCPKTCGRCGQRSNYQRSPSPFTPFMNPMVGAVGTFGVGVGRPNGACVDGTGANGVSECPRNAALCNHPSYSAFMRVECPVTCGVCGSRAGVSRTGRSGRRSRRRGSRNRRRRLRDGRRRRRGGRRGGRRRRSRGGRRGRSRRRRN